MDFPLAAADRVLRAALEEDVGTGDVTTLLTVPAGRRTRAVLVAKEALCLAGLPSFVRTFELLAPNDPPRWKLLHGDGESVKAGTRILEGEGDARTLLTGERTALNLLQRLSGIATMTARWTASLAGTGAKLVDTRKTAPGLRALEKYAVRAGGGANHRFGLFDGILVKENHIRAAGSIQAAVAGARAGAHHLLKVEVEVTTLAELDEALATGADAVLLDNMDVETMREAVRRVNGRAVTEASGNMSEERLAAVAATGVDLISSGALTHSPRAADLSLLFE